jgi:hypothetical protein
MLRHIRKINALEIDVGVVEPKTHNSKGAPVSMAALYLWQDQGTKHIPKRETLKPAIEKKMQHRRIAKALVESAVTGGYRDTLRDGGEQLARGVKQQIMRIKSPALKPATIRQRVNGGSNPLVDTGQLLRSIGSKVK